MSSAQKRIRFRPARRQTFQGRIKFAFVLFHESETATIEDQREPLRGDIQVAKGYNPAQTILQVVCQFFLGQEQDVQFVAVFPPAGERR
jgi:hypothetical protein